MNPIPISTYTSPTVILELIYRLKIKDVMRTDVITAGRGDSLRSIQHLMRANSITGVPIVQGTRIIGIISMDDIIQALDKGYIDQRSELYMSRNLIVLEDDMPVSFAITYFDTYPYHRFPVLNRQKELVGMVTTRDITARLLIEMNREVAALEEQSVQHHVESDRGHVVKTFSVMKHNFEKAGYASTEIKKFLKLKGLSPQLIRRAAVASYELEINLVVHSEGGTITFEYSPQQLALRVTDSGPGIPDTDAAIREGFSTADSWIRSLGFGAGMGLPNVIRAADEFSITSQEGTGTSVSVLINLEESEPQKQNNGEDECL
jgi:anti-sigma regulatory factor (Ser/Thr protein kinase)/CBS domain-containing protein